MAFENLTERLQNVFKNLRGKKKITEADVTEITKEIRVALLEAVGLHVGDVVRDHAEIGLRVLQPADGRIVGHGRLTP